ncbi:Oligosaccharide biosynthesis protein Alg14 like (plasmid) [Herpetosiphon aurantiacus DSM 785]|uniref:Oligosaccharide biosynthesis protein Alg14 like n=1 Tax=Herpetosiphon aurantiacus (strain ATCC 23779 / DSM 785 / 114-95) TaxID=316274 RepID=A9B8R0_HERA2|nr:Oligosaccharide biosynthesis protein Alg14 like [Herpetosiphon aurantiacus DSM 785]
MKIGIICSHGGHWTETRHIFAAFEGYDRFIATYMSARAADVQQVGRAYFTQDIGRNPYRMARTFVWAATVLRKERPQVLISMGAEIAIPFFYLGKLFGCKTIFIESWCRVTSVSQTGKLVYPVSDVFFVQWPQLCPIAGKKAQFAGAIL